MINGLSIRVKAQFCYAPSCNAYQLPIQPECQERDCQPGLILGLHALYCRNGYACANRLKPANLMEGEHAR